MIIDTDVLIWYLRGNTSAKKAIIKNAPFKISVITYMELIQGVQNKKELAILQKMLNNWSVEIIQVNDRISTYSMYLVESYFLSHSLGICDAQIAATALGYGEILLTANDKHYGFIPNIQIQKFIPRTDNPSQK